jgi:hypothetical protein
VVLACRRKRESAWWCPMTKIRLAELAETCGARLRAGGQELAIDQAKKIVRQWLADLDSEIEGELDAERASASERRQLREALEVVRGAVPGILGSVTIARPQQRDRDPHGGQQGRAGPETQPEWEERKQREERQRRQQQGGVNILGVRFGGEPARPPQKASQQLSVMIVTETLYMQLRAVCEALDRLLKIAGPPEEEPPVPWARTSEFLVEAQKLFAAHVQGNGKLALDELALLETRLRARYGIEVIWADDDTRQYFKVYANEPGDGSYETRKPAIVADGRLALRGEALGPVQDPSGGGEISGQAG